ncbi:biotin carboxylase N-terminal domain-containing protein [Arthrobacter zhaoguopingii]|uniref:ATP-binding protein n=1 Tax=Arthrobacter zhaoguopingii TaxID=2681491 RepID=UPI0013597E82|nr:biotin carboxylase N-terminal domain-containing protein [Arthrobacter zhaoguopingii]
MITKILIANRGEIAVRIMSTCRDLGIATVAVHSEADAASYHVRSADESVNLGSGPASENYLKPSAILEVARATGAEAIHPGYGFLSENAGFSAAVEAAGLIFIGPPAAAISTMGGKVAAREVAVAAGVPLVPGSAGAITSPGEVRSFGDEHGYPLLVKASAGGGGRGMRLIEDAAAVEEAVAAAVREATAAFGNGEVYLERYLTRARHVEVQVFADRHGKVVWIGDRDCSVQRRHQKLVEESPAPGLSDKLRRAMGEAAVRLARRVDYVGAGTVEFLVEGDGFYFLEMNTRIQVEHPVTEMVQGLDLIAEQIRVAAGEPLSIPASGPPPRGVAIEARINAEDVAGGLFIPSPGVIRSISVPSHPGLRFDAGYQGGDEVLPLYDSLIGKMIAWGPDRDAAIRRLTAGLEELVIDGVSTTVPAALAVLRHPDFQAQRFTTLWLESSVTFPEAEDSGGGGTADEAEGGGLLARNEVEVAGRFYTIPYFDDSPAPGRTRSAVPDTAAPADEGPGRTRTANRGRSKKESDGTIRAPMQGTIVKVNVAEGDIIEAGKVLFVLEAMKMENPIKAPFAGTVGPVSIVVGETPAAGALLTSLTAAQG